MMNEKELYCIARYVREYVEASKGHTRVDLGLPCFSCKYAIEETCNFEFWEHITKLAEITGVSISPKATREQFENAKRFNGL